MHDHSSNPLFPGVPLALASAVLFGLSTPAAKGLVGTVDPWLLAGLLYLGAGLGLAATRIGRGFLGMAADEPKLRRSDMPWLAGVVAFGGLLGPLFLVFGLSMTTASSGSLLLNLEGIATMGIAWVVFRENVDRRLLIGALAIVAGAVALSWSGSGLSMDMGGLLVAAACLCWGIDNNLTRKLSASDPIQIAMIKGLVAGATNTVLALSLGAALPGPLPLFGGAIVGFLGVGLSLVLFMLALRHLGTARTGAYFSLAPFVGALASIAVFGEAVTSQLVIAGLLMAIGLWLHLSERHDHEHTHEAIEHDHRHVHDEHHQHDHDGPVSEPHSHWHRHEPIRHKHPHYPDLHHRHSH